MWGINVLWIVGLAIQAEKAPDTRQATGVKVGEVSQTSAILWVRLTARTSRNARGILRKGRPAKRLPSNISADALEGACPGAPGRVRLRLGPMEELEDTINTGWVPVTAKTDFTHQFRLSELKPGTVYQFTVDTADTFGEARHDALRGRFETAPPRDAYADVTFTVITGQAYKDVDHPEGFHIYEAMAKLRPKFIVPTGDTVYYDSEDPLACTPAVARYHWHRMYSLPRHVAFHLRVPGYWMKDDHDTIINDCWPGMKQTKMLPMTFPQGQRIFREQVPMGEKTYRTYCWGQALQIWLVEGRDFRSPNTMKAGPDKTIWGEAQKQWLKRTILDSDADWKVLISPTPLVGPDRDNKADNHANAAFAHEGGEIRQWLHKYVPNSLFAVCGDRHWQYHSIDPETGVHEFCCGPASDEHAGGVPRGKKHRYAFLRVKGGFLSVAVHRSGVRSVITFRHHDVRGNVVYEQTRAMAAPSTSRPATSAQTRQIKRRALRR